MAENAFFFLGVLIFLLIVGGICLLAYHLDQQKRLAFRQQAMALGLQYQPDINYGLGKEFRCFSRLNSGSNHYAAHIISGQMDGRFVRALEVHYQTESTNSKGERTVHHHYHGVFTVSLPRAFPGLTIRPEGMFSKIAQALGYDDIDFESVEFSRRYCVRSPDKKFAYDVLHARAIEFILSEHAVDWEFNGSLLAAFRPGHLCPGDVAPYLQTLTAFCDLLPDYLLQPAA